ncbi:MAG: efflux RND transporter periplasmic adaptor subunit [Candidatus Eisenbacteria bacterium]
MRRHPRRRTRSPLAAAGLFWLVLFSAAVVLLGSCSRDGSKEERKAVPIEIGFPERKDLMVVLTFVGEIRGQREAGLTFEVGGKVVRIGVGLGDSVEKGDVLAALDDTKAQANLVQAEAGYSKAKLDAERIERLHKDAIASDNQLEGARLAVEQARAAFVSAQEMLKDCSLVSPFSGLVAQRNVEFGEVILAMGGGPPDFIVVDISSVKVKLGIPESEIGRVKVGQKASLSVAAYPEREFEGVVSSVSPLVGSPTKTIEAEVAVKNPDGALKPGMTVDLRLVTGERKGVLAVPERALRREVGIATLFVAKDGKAHEQKITTGVLDGGWVEVLSGLGERDSVVVRGQFQLKENDRVQIITAAAGDSV